jgi:UDP-glucose 4-epimerase
MSAWDWRSARVLVTGARGFIATGLCRRLIEAGATVYGVSRAPNSVDHPRMLWWRADLTELAETERTLTGIGPDFVFHLAGHVTGSQQLSEVKPSLAANLVSTVHLLTAAAEARTSRIILAGSMQEPQESTGTTAVPSSPYAASKWACTAYARMFHALYQLPVVVARPMLVYGPGQWDQSKLLPYLIVSLLTGVAPKLTSGHQELDWVYIDDVVDGLMTVARSPAIEGGSIDLGSGVLTSIRRIAEEVSTIIGCRVVPVFGALPDRPLESPRVARVEETRQLTGWTATTCLQEGLSRTVDWYRKEIARPVATQVPRVE